MNSYNTPPILFMVFNRPDLTRRVFSRIREAQPSQLFIAADGPRANVPTDYSLCKEARKIVERVDWPCEVHSLFRDNNLGCKKAVSEAITWFFEHVEMGIILEDDCVPDPTFFRFCDELLERYQDDKRILVIRGDNYHKKKIKNQYSYHFSNFHGSWGWATWRRSWDLYDEKMTQWPELRNTSWLLNILEDPTTENNWKKNFDTVYEGKLDTWDYQWIYSCWKNGGLSVVPTVNMITNIGHDDRATHTKNPNNPLANLPSKAMRFPLKHPQDITHNLEEDLGEVIQPTLRHQRIIQRVLKLFRKV